jgi:hypothetical protein
MVLLLFEEFPKPASRTVSCQPEYEVKKGFPNKGQNPLTDIKLKPLRRSLL